MAETTLELLRIQEWQRVETGGGSGGLSPMIAYVCLMCGAEQHQGHADGCTLAELIKWFEPKEVSLAN